MSGQQEFFAPLLDPEMPAPAGLTTWNGSDPQARYGVYRNNVVSSLIDALADTFPVTRELVGEEFFRAMAGIYVRQQPPRSQVLAFYGESLPQFIEQFPPAASVPYLADVARLELLRVRAFHAADTEEFPAETFARHLGQAEDLSTVYLTLHPSLGLLRSPYAVTSLWAAHQGITDIAKVDPYKPEQALVIRIGLDVQVRRIDVAVFDFVVRLDQGESLGNASDQTHKTHPEFELVSALGFLVQLGGISGIRTGKEIPT
ncbi:MAG: putative DNA-binding domain-containing protein [Gammaproteobacteria bacterium]|nr:putative DNA-binding domain-containing protein [Gammaproteobacteria bacterium]